MISDFRRILTWLMVFAAFSGAFFWLAPSTGGIREAVVLALGFGAIVALSFLAYAVFEAGSGVPPSYRKGRSVHRLGWGAVLVIAAGGTALAACGLLLLRDAEPFWFWALAPPIVAAWVYWIAMTMLYRVVCDERELRVRNWRLGWKHHDWNDLVSFYDYGTGCRLRFERTEFVEIMSGVTGIDHLRAVANEALEQKKRSKPPEDA